MRDERGLYYYPDPANHNLRVYVRKNDRGEVEFRLWEANFPEFWEQHQWLASDIIRQASELYRQERNPDVDPMKLYDENIALALLKEAEF